MPGFQARHRQRQARYEARWRCALPRPPWGDRDRRAVYFFEVRNVFDKTFVASANNITNTIDTFTGLQNPGSILATTGTGSIYAGAPRAYVAGMRLAFR